LTFGESLVGVGSVLSLNFLFELIAAAKVFRSRDDFVVDAANNLFDDCVGGQNGWDDQRAANYQQQGKSSFLHEDSLATWGKPWGDF
jgi:hypothetical protein